MKKKRKKRKSQQKKINTAWQKTVQMISWIDFFHFIYSIKNNNWEKLNLLEKTNLKILVRSFIKLSVFIVLGHRKFSVVIITEWTSDKSEMQKKKKYFFYLSFLILSLHIKILQMKFNNYFFTYLSINNQKWKINK